MKENATSACNDPSIPLTATPGQLELVASGAVHGIEDVLLSVVTEGAAADQKPGYRPNQPVPSKVFAAPLLPGKTDAWKAAVAEISGARKEEYLQARHNLGVTKEVVCLQQTPHGDFVVVYIEALKYPARHA